MKSTVITSLLTTLTCIAFNEAFVRAPLEAKVAELATSIEPKDKEIEFLKQKCVVLGEQLVHSERAVSYMIRQTKNMKPLNEIEVIP